jgi:aspartyl-tRNA(Asn)/glutamyl-tRNA(Gln) amidotransferase subunit A
VKFEKVSLPEHPWETLAVLFIVAEVRAAFDDLIRSGRVMELASASRPGFDPSGGEFGKATASDYVKAMRVRAEGQTAMSAFFRKHDVIVAPTLPFPAPKIDESFKTLFETLSDPVGAMGNVCGLPAIALPCGFTAKLPVSMQVVGPALDEGRLLAIASAFQTKTSFHRERPPLS